MYEVLIIGGGLSGLVNAICLSRQGIRVALLEKNQYPFHRVCGEYISNETLPFLQSLGFDPFALGAVSLHTFRLTSPKGNTLEMPLDLGGFGLSRYTMDDELCQIAKKCGAEIFESCKVTDIQTLNTHFRVKTDKGQIFESTVVIGAYGKRSNLDNSLHRAFFQKKSPYIGVKYHIYTDLQADHMIALHNFKDGYCGISRVEDDKFCLCYLTSRQNLKDYGSIERLEQEILHKNPFLKDIFEKSEFIYDKPKVINEISFAPKTLLENGILMCGDTAGMITPLCGNGMAIAIHSAKILSELLIEHFSGKINRREMEDLYQKKWRHLFAARLGVGRNIQNFFGSPLLSEVLLKTAKNIKPLAKFLVSNTHGRVF